MGPHIRHCPTPTELAAALVSALLTPMPALASGASTARIPTGDTTRRVPADTTGHRPLADAACDAPHDPDLADHPAPDIQAAGLSPRDRTVTATVPDDTGLTCVFASSRQYGSVSAAETPIMEEMLRRAEDLRRSLSRRETATATRPFLRPHAYGLKLLGEVRRAQRRGAPAGLPRGLRAHVKNDWLPGVAHGWLPRVAHGRRVRSIDIDAFTGEGRTYRTVVLSHDKPTRAYGVRTIERIAQAVHRGLSLTQSRERRGLSQDTDDQDNGDHDTDSRDIDDQDTDNRDIDITPENEISEKPDGSCSSPDGPPPPGRDGPEPDATP